LGQEPGLRAVYGRFYREIASSIRRDAGGRIVDLGSRLGNLKAVIPDCITTYISPNPWIERVEDGNLILFEVWHHLQFPGSALKEFRSVLTPGGRVIIFRSGNGPDRALRSGMLSA
jgi:hypothetical protein